MKEKTIFLSVFAHVLFVVIMTMASRLVSADQINVTVDGVAIGTTIKCIYVDDQPLLDAEQVAPHLKAKYFRYAGTYVITGGFIYQYGKTISVVQENNVKRKGFVACVETETVPTVQVDDAGTVYSPCSFLSAAVNGTVDYDSTAGTVHFTLGRKLEIGDIAPKAAKFAEELEKRGYTVQQGDINQARPVQVCNDGYTPDCNANNADYPYLMTLLPPYPETETTPDLPWMVRMTSREAIVIIGQTPPECIYFSYINYLMNRFYEDETPPVKKLFASLGDSVSNFKLSKRGDGKKVFEKPVMIIAAADKTIIDDITKAAKKAKVSKKDIHTLVLPYELLKFGLEETTDVMGFLHRTSLYANEKEKDAYLRRPTVEILRITPRTSTVPAEYLPMEPFYPRGSGIQEFALNKSLEQLKTAIIAQFGDDYNYEELPTRVWLPEGMSAIQGRLNVLGEDRDTIYLRTEDKFLLGDDDIVVVYGVDHTTTGQSVYSNVSCYGALHYNGFGGINNQVYANTANRYLPGNDKASHFYVWKFARFKYDETTYVVPEDVDDNLTGVNKTEPVFMGFRAYINETTQVGPANWEILYDRVLKFARKK